MDIKQQRAFRTSGGREQSGHQAEKVFQDQNIRGRRTVRTSGRKGFSGSGHQGEEDKWDIKQQMTGGTSSSRKQHGHQATKGI